MMRICLFTSLLAFALVSCIPSLPSIGGENYEERVTFTEDYDTVYAAAVKTLNTTGVITLISKDNFILNGTGSGQLLYSMTFDTSGEGVTIIVKTAFPADKVVFGTNAKSETQNLISEIRRNI